MLSKFIPYFYLHLKCFASLHFMQKKIYILLLILLVTIKLHSQHLFSDFFIKKYISSGITKNNSCFLLVRFSSATPDIVKRRINLSALRKLSPFVFIIKSNPVFLSVEEKKSLNFFNINNIWKLSPTAEKYAAKNKNTSYRYTIEITGETFINDVLSRYFPKTNISPRQKIFSVVTTFAEIEQYFLEDDRVIGIDVIISKPAEELGVPGFDLSANNINLVHSKYPFINGEEMHASIKEDYYDTADIDIKGRFDPSSKASKNISNHANFMATIITGAGNSVYYAKGAAREAHISSSSFESILPDEDAYYSQNQITVQNHSYGTVIDNNYGLNAVAFDRNANNDTALLHVFSAGNTGDATPDAGTYSGVPGFANLTGNFKMAKNVITVGATDTFGNPAALSSHGPAYDGRIKPDICAFQKNGTSESAALVSGTTLLMQQLFQSKNNNNLLPSALARAVLINSADDVFNPGPDYFTGFGNLNAEKAMETIEAGKYVSGTITNGNRQTFTITVPANISLLKISLAWNDTAAPANAPTALMNDLDLTMTNKITGEVWQPWVLSSIANADSLAKNAVRKRDSLNNEEQITINNVLAGNYRISVNGFNVISPFQKFYIAYNWHSIHSFTIKNFSSSDFAQSSNEEIIHWQTNIAGTASVEYALPPFNKWNEIQPNADLSKKYVEWHTPDTISKAMIRVKAANNFYYSDTFLITTLAKPTTGFLCGDSLFIYWNKLKGINQYQVYQLGEKYMEPLVTTNDTAVIINIHNLKTRYLSVAPMLADGTTGVKSYGFDYAAQNAGCIISSFYADTKDNTATLSLTLGTLYNADSVIIQKNTATGFENISNIFISNTLHYKYFYQPLPKGVTFFRVKIVLRSGKIIYSDKTAVYYNEPGKYLVFPNPAKRNQIIEIYTPLPAEEAFTLLDASGKIVLKKPIQSVHEYIPATNLSPGIYIYKIIKKEGNVSVGKVVVF